MRPLVLLLLVAACTPGLSRNVQSLSASGAFVESTELLLRAHGEGDPKAAELLPAAAQDAYRAELDRAREAEADDDLPSALGIFDRTIALAARVEAAGGPGLPEGVLEERADVAARTAVLYAARATVAYDDGRWEDALDGWRRAEATAPDATPSELSIPKALARLGDVAREERRYREAISLYDQAEAAGGGEQPRMWAASIHAAYGRHALQAGACRKAVQELTAATALPFDIKLGKDLDAARACATREIIVHPFKDLVEGGIENANLGVLLVDQLNHHLRSHGSRYLRLLDPTSKAAKAEVDVAGRRFDVEGHLTRVDVEPRAAKTSTQTATGVLKVPCETGGEPRCEEEVNVTYTLLEERLQVAISGAIKVVDVHSGEQVATRPLDIRVSKVRRQASKARVTDVRGFVVDAPVGVTASDRMVGIKGDARNHFRKSDPLPDADRVVDEAMVRLAGTAADAVLAAVDGEDDLPDPEDLVLVVPVVSADDISFGDSWIEEGQAEDLEFGHSDIEEGAEAPVEPEPAPE